jgi:subtilase family serine protease
MQRSWLIPLSVCAVVVFLLWAVNPLSSGQTGPQNRILQQVDASQMTVLRGSLHPLAKAQYDRGRVNPAMEMRGVSINFKPSSSQEADLQQLLAAQRDPSSREYHKWLTPEQYAARFGMSQGDLDRVVGWLQSEGFAGIHVSRGHTQVSFSGTAAQVGSAFRTEIHHFDVNGKSHVANATALAVPSALAGTVMSIRNVSDFRPHPRARRLPTARFTSGQTGNHFVGPGDFATIYDLKPLYAAGFDGTGVTIAVAGQTQIDVSDANTFRSLSGLPSNPPQTFLVPSTGNSTVFAGSDLDEANLDVEWSGAVAKNATILYVYVGDDLTKSVFDALFYAIDNDLAPVVSISYGECEPLGTMADAQTLQMWAQEANSFGETFVGPSGDTGAADCDSGASATQGLAVDIPAAVPEVTGVGGTEFMGDNTAHADAPYWGDSNGTTDVVDTALTYIPEMAWNDSPVTGTGPVADTALAATGGGKSIFFTKPSWQTALTPADGARDVPDVSLAGSPDHDGYLVCSRDNTNEPTCTNGSFRFSDGSLTVFGGTSVSVQAFAGILGILNQATQSAGLGNVNPDLYTLAASAPAAFHDVKAGSNIVPCTSGSTNCPASAPFQIGYNAGTGYDLATGLGSLNANNLVLAWPGFAATPSYTVKGTDVTISSAGGSGSSTITVSSTTGFGGASGATVDLTCAFVPPQPQSAGLSCSFGSGGSVTLSNSTTSATATMQIDTATPHAASNPSAEARPHAPIGWFMASGGALLAGVFVIGAPKRRWRWIALFGLCFTVFLAVGIGCGGGNSSSGGGSTPTAATPTFNPAPGTFTGSVTVTLADSTAGATILCTTDGTTPTVLSPVCAFPIVATSTSTIQAFAVATGFNNSAVASGMYTIQAGTPSGTYIVAVTAKSGGISQTTNVNVTVQ